MEFGAHWVQQWSSEVTHVIVDNGLDFRDVLRTLNVSELPVILLVFPLTTWTDVPRRTCIS